MSNRNHRTQKFTKMKLINLLLICFAVAATIRCDESDEQNMDEILNEKLAHFKPQHGYDADLYRNAKAEDSADKDEDGDDMNNEESRSYMTLHDKPSAPLLQTHFERHRKKIKKYGKGDKKRRFIKHEYKRKDAKGKVKKTWLEDLKDED